MKNKERKKIKVRFFIFPFFSLIFFLFSFNLFAENNFSLRLAPVLRVPVGQEQLTTGFGADVALDWAFLTFANTFSLGINAGGGFANIPTQAGDPFTLLEGRGGLFFRLSPLDRWAFNLGFNAGLYQHSRGEITDTRGLLGGNLGAQFHLSPYFSLFADGGFTYRNFANKPMNTVDLALGIRFNLSEMIGGRARVKIEKTQQHRIFPVSWAWYENNPVAAVTITNEEPNAITDITLSFFMESYMSEPWVFVRGLRLKSGESIEVPVTALFNEALLNLNTTVNANGVIHLQYRSLGAKKETVTPIQMPVFGRNILSWDDDRRAAAFVSPKDDAARLFARNVAAIVEGAGNREQVAGSVPRNVRYAVALFEALRLYRISYVVDPSSSYVALSGDESAIDSLNYPYQTLYYRGGDCDDLSILFCSLLEALDIESAFITVPGHIYIAFEVGDENFQRNNMIIEFNSKRWLPVEITIPDQGFFRAWQIGIMQSLQASAAGAAAEIFPIRDCWQVYPSVTVPGSGDNPPVMPEGSEIIRALTAELSKIGR